MIDDLSMAHDNLQRELSDIKRLMSKDKHELIKSNIALNQEVKVLKKGEALLEKTLLAYKKRVIENEKLSRQNKRYREALEFYADRKTYERRHDPYEPLDTDINNDRGEKARKALEGEE